MKTLIRILIPLLVFAGLVTLDVFIYHWVISAVAPLVSVGWLGLIRIVLALVEVVYTTSLIIAVTAWSAIIAVLITGG